MSAAPYYTEILISQFLRRQCFDSWRRAKCVASFCSREAMSSTWEISSAPSCIVVCEMAVILVYNQRAANQAVDDMIWYFGPSHIRPGCNCYMAWRKILSPSRQTHMPNLNSAYKKRQHSVVDSSWGKEMKFAQVYDQITMSLLIEYCINRNAMTYL